MLSCKKEKVPVSDVLFGLKLSRHTILADGSSKVTITVKLNAAAETGKRGVIFNASSGNFLGGTNSSITVTASFVSDSLIAKATYVAPLNSNKIYFTVMPDIPDKEKYTLYDSITVEKSQAFSIKLNPSSFGLKSNFASEDTIKGILLNSSGNGVSLGTSVIFEDLLINQQPANGQFRSVVDKSDVNSSVSAIYSVGPLPLGTNIWLKSTVLDSIGGKTSINNSVKITITQ